MQYDMYNAGRLTPYTYQNAAQQDADMNGRIVRSMQDTPQYAQNYAEAIRQGMTPVQAASDARQRAASGTGNLMPYMQNTVYGGDETVLTNAAKQAAGVAMMAQDPSVLTNYANTFPMQGARLATPVPFNDAKVLDKSTALVRGPEGRLISIPTSSKPSHIAAMTEALKSGNPLDVLSAQYKAAEVNRMKVDADARSAASKLAVAGVTGTYGVQKDLSRGVEAAKVRAAAGKKAVVLSAVQIAGLRDKYSKINRANPKAPQWTETSPGVWIQQPVTPVTRS
jgi:hypothetical protein